jgi:sRNA-binding carbon storage regulator CsrA
LAKGDVLAMVTLHKKGNRARLHLQGPQGLVFLREELAESRQSCVNAPSSGSIGHLVISRKRDEAVVAVGWGRIVVLRVDGNPRLGFELEDDVDVQRDSVWLGFHEALPYEPPMG